VHIAEGEACFAGKANWIRSHGVQWVRVGGCVLRSPGSGYAVRLFARPREGAAESHEAVRAANGARI
jgi:hypothetical protein